MTIVVLTPTRQRPAALEICRDYVARQKGIPGLLHLIVDGGPDYTMREPTQMRETEAGVDEVVLRRWQPDNLPPALSLGDNVRHGLDYIRSVVGPAKVVMFEDDDWYAPDYVWWSVRELERRPLVGEGCSFYYNVQNRTWMTCNNHSHASLCSTAWDDEEIGDEIRNVLMKTLRSFRKAFLDVNIWKELGSQGKVFVPRPKRRVVGIKGVPGRKGIGVGHRRQRNSDRKGILLKRLIGDDAQRYEKHFGHHGEGR